MVGWGWYSLSTVLDDYSRYILAWTLRTSMQASDVTETLDSPGRARAWIACGSSSGRGCSATTARATSRRNSPTYLDRHGIVHHAGRTLPPDDAGEDRTLSPVDEERGEAREVLQSGALERALVGFVEDYNHRRYHEALQNVTPADVYHGRRPAILARREQIKQRTLTARRRENLRTPHHAAQQPEVSLLQQPQWSGLV